MDLTQRLQLVVDATDRNTETTFRRITAAAGDTGQAVSRSAADVAGAANRVAQAQLKADDAAGQLRVSQQRLMDLQEKGNASAAQLAAAEEKVAAAQRRVHMAAKDVENALEGERDAQKHATAAHEEGAAATEKSSRAGEKMREQVGELRGAVVGLVAGYSLADWATEAFTGFLEGARGAASLASSMNATIEQAGTLNTLMGSVGLEADDLLEIQAEFAQKVAASDSALSDFGATVKLNDDGTTNWALTLEDALVNLQKIPDATVRNAKGFALFGEEGYKQLSRLLNSGISVKDALARIGTPFHDKDVAAVREYDAAMMKVSQSAGGAGRDLGRLLLPVVAGVLEAFGAFVDVVSGIPAPIGLAVAAAVVLGLAQRSAATEGGLLAGALAAVTGRALGLRTAVAEAALSTTLLGRGMGVAKVAGGGLTSMLGGPAGLAVLGLGVGFELLNQFVGDNSQKSKEAEQANSDLASALKAANGVVTDSVREQAALSAQQSGLLGTAQKAGVAQGVVTDALLGNKDAYEKVKDALAAYQAEHTQMVGDERGNLSPRLDDEAKAAEGAGTSLDDLSGTVKDNAKDQQALAGELGKTTDKAALATAAMDTLTGMVDAGTTAGKGFADAAKAAALAQDASTASSDAAKAAVDAYNATTRDAVKTTYDLINSRYAAEDANFRFAQAVDGLRDAEDDHKTSVDEVRQAQVALYEAALSAASASADAAVASARANGTVLTTAAEAKLRADDMIGDLRQNLDTPGLTKAAKEELQGLIDQLTTAQQHGDIKALVTLTGTKEAGADLDATTQPRTAPVTVESRGGPAVITYLDGIAQKRRLALVEVQSRGGPAVDKYLDGLRGRDRLALINVESRGGPAVDRYLDTVASKPRLAIIRVESRGGPAVDRYLDDLATKTRTAVIDVRRNGNVPGSPVQAPAVFGAPTVAGRMGGDVIVQSLQVTVQADSTGRVSPQAAAIGGREVVRAAVEYTRQNGNGWLKALSR